jgi:hypothetical protein
MILTGRRKGIETGVLNGGDFQVVVPDYLEDDFDRETMCR